MNASRNHDRERLEQLQREQPQGAPVPDRMSANDRPADALDPAELARFPRAAGEVVRLRRCTSSTGRSYFDLRRWYQRRDADELGPTKQGETIRLHEAPAIVAALWLALDAPGRARVRELLAAGAGAGAGADVPEGGARG